MSAAITSKPRTYTSKHTDTRMFPKSKNNTYRHCAIPIVIIIKCTKLTLPSRHLCLLLRGQIVVKRASSTVDMEAQKRERATCSERYNLGSVPRRSVQVEAERQAGVRFGAVDVALSGSVDGSPLSLAKKTAGGVGKSVDFIPGLPWFRGPSRPGGYCIATRCRRCR